jgi:hypothetical protein
MRKNCNMKMNAVLMVNQGKRILLVTVSWLREMNLSLGEVSGAVGSETLANA